MTSVIKVDVDDVDLLGSGPISIQTIGADTVSANGLSEGSE
jgi:hypothetical protein